MIPFPVCRNVVRGVRQILRVREFETRTTTRVAVCDSTIFHRVGARPVSRAVP